MRWANLLLGVVLGVLLLGAVRFALVPPAEPVHHHANFAVFVDGERLDLSADRFMEDVASCSPDPLAVRPRERIHLHNNDPDVVHVHHGGATWGHLFTNLGMGLGGDYLILADGRRLFAGDDGRTLKFFVNGRQVSELHNDAVRSADRMLVSFGSEPAEAILASQFDQVAANAEGYNLVADPAGCASGHGEHGFMERLRHAFLGS